MDFLPFQQRAVLDHLLKLVDIQKQALPAILLIRAARAGSGGCKLLEIGFALERRFQSIVINPPTPKQTIEILKGLRTRYEQHHSVVISDEAIQEAVVLSDRYITDRHLPDKAIDVIDEAGSRARLQANMKPDQVRELDKQVQSFDEQLP